jgi:high-affinity Fe2+/Pb2+ permease
MIMEKFGKLLSQFLTLIAIAFFFYAAYEGVMGDGGSTSVFTGVGVLVVVLIGSYFIDKFTHVY